MNKTAFTKLVAQMRAAETDYWTNGRQHNDLVKALDYEGQVDKEIKRTADFLAEHPESQPSDDRPEWKFFCLVTVLRDKTKAYFAFSKKYRSMPPQQQAASYDELNELRKTVYHYEADVDKYLRHIDYEEKRAQGYTITFEVIRTRAHMKQPQVMVTTENEQYAYSVAYDYNKSNDGSIYGVRSKEKPPVQPQQAAIAFPE